MFTGGTDAKVEFPVLWPPDAKNRLTEKKNADAGKHWRQEEKGTQKTRWLDGINNSVNMSLSKPGEGEGQESLAFYSPWGC